MNKDRRSKSPRLRWRLHEAINQWINFRAILDEIIREGSKNALCLSMISILLLFLISCVPQSSQLATTEELNDEERAQYALLEFLENLHNGKYDDATWFYSGSYEHMIDHNPGIDPNDHAALLRNACTINGMQCLRGKIIGLEEKVSDAKFVFMVELLKDDGTLFMHESCCGSDETSSPPQSVFHFTVIKVDHNEFAVMDMPPYIP